MRERCALIRVATVKLCPLMANNAAQSPQSARIGHLHEAVPEAEQVSRAMNLTDSTRMDELSEIGDEEGVYGKWKA